MLVQLGAELQVWSGKRVSFAVTRLRLQKKQSDELPEGHVCRFALARAKVGPAWWFVWGSVCKSGRLVCLLERGSVCRSGSLETDSRAVGRFSLQKRPLRNSFYALMRGNLQKR